MRFLGNHGSSLELSVVGYQFPELEGVPWDSNWLVIAGRAELDGRQWKFRDSCLLTGEASDLADWLEARSKDTSEDSEIDFLEPYLYFRWSQGALLVRLGPWTSGDKVEYLRFSPSSDELMSAASSLREDLRKYPYRPERNA